MHARNSVDIGGSVTESISVILDFGLFRFWILDLGFWICKRIGS